ncbi:hypothetical protein HPP92_016020 [Vanilla planifolia]|uniref:X8 domain-containing protein n=1 Tax=Vanilla planifolia TaxID=51239 RepID=A0A835UQ35_VANPL|nr:hypothetical protein HPP92_016020 [Vanilla planifolia]
MADLRLTPLATSVVAAFLLSLSLFPQAADATLGVNWGTMTYHRLPPKTVARLLKDNKITKVKLFDADPYTMDTLAGTGIEVMVAVNNLLLFPMNDYATAKAWVAANITQYRTQSPESATNPSSKNTTAASPTLHSPRSRTSKGALDEAGLGDEVKATVPLNADIYYPPFKPVPSAGKWRDDVADLMSDIVKFYNQTGAPFTVNIYPFFSLYINPNFPADFAFFDGKAAPLVDGDFSYTNVFDANYDTLLAALRSEDCGDVPIIVGEVGWPTDGDVHANPTIAGRFYAGLTRKMAKRSGTPQKPKQDIDVYLFGLFDEEAKSTLPGDFERSWGIFTTDGRAKFPIDLSGGGEAGKWPAEAVGVEYLETKWCVLDAEKATNESQVQESVDYACKNGADCAALGQRASCAGVDTDTKASYAFNSYFQALGQASGSCDFGGLAKITAKNYTAGSCKFGIGIKPYVDGSLGAARGSVGDDDEISYASARVAGLSQVLLAIFLMAVMGS